MKTQIVTCLSFVVLVVSVLLGSDECPEPSKEEVCNGIDDDGDGYVDEGYDLDYDGFVVDALCTGVALTDCDDQDPGVNPGVAERCDGVDNDCNGLIDDDLRGVFFRDGDADGFGTGDIVSCQAADGFVPARGDCVDTDPAIYPGADDPPRDGIDQDCGGSQGPDPHVGLNGTSMASVAEATGAAAPGVTVWVGPGDYLESGIHVVSDGIRIAAVRPDGSTTVGGTGNGSIFVVDGAETSGAILDGLTIYGGSAEQGGGVVVYAASVTITNGALRNNTASSAGGGVYVSKGTLVLRNTAIEQNTGYLAAGVGIETGTATIHGCRFAGNSSATSAGGLYLDGADTTLTGSTLVANVAGYRGGGLFANQSVLNTAGTRFNENRCTDLDGEGGGIFLNDVGGSFVASSLRGNRADSGGGAAVFWSDIPFRYVKVLANSGSVGGGLAFSFSNPRLEHCLISENTADSGGGIYAYGARLSMAHCSVVGNTAGWGGGILLGQQNDSSEFTSSVFAYNVGHNLQNLSDAEQEVSWCDLYSDDGPNHNVWLSTGSFEAEPGFVRFVANGNPDDDDLHVLPGSPLRDAAQPGEWDSDGSPADIGYYGGEIDLSYYEDRDADTLFDGWEVQHGLNTSIDDARSDPDHDNLSNGMEFWAGTFPQVADGDQDGWVDGDEVVSGVDPNDWYSRPGLEGFAVARVPGDFVSIQDAVWAMRRQGTIEVDPGVWRGDILIAGRNVTLRPTGSAEGEVVIEAASGRAVSAAWSVLDVRDVTISGGRHRAGGGMYLAFVQGGLSGVAIEGNAAIAGGGLFLDYSDVTILQSRIANNQANAGSWYEDGGGVYAWYANPVIEHTVIEDNLATGDGGGLYLESSYPLLTCCVVRGNQAREGGGVFSIGSGPVLTQTVVTANAASSVGGGMLISTGSMPYVLNTVFAYNSGENVYLPSNAEGVLYEFDSSNLYNPPGLANHNLDGIDDDNLAVEPGFLTYDDSGLPLDLHLAVASPMVDAGDTLVHDPDASRSDLGIYGGPVADQWDRDRDGYPDYFWPGTIDQPPEGFDPAAYDANDTDPLEH